MQQISNKSASIASLTLKHFIVISLACSLIGCSSKSRNATLPVESSTHSFAIYAVAFTPEQPWNASTIGDPATLPLSKEPVLTDADILTYDFAKHEILLNRMEPVLSRLPKDTAWGAPFVVVADGQRIYLGAFMSPVSSQSASVPTIVIWPPADSNPLTIDRAYPAPGFAVGPDPRSDERIRVAFAGLKKLK